MPEPTRFHVTVLALNLLVREESKELVLSLFKEQNIKDPQAYEKVTTLAQDMLADITNQRR